jgi:hypothetical protein
MGQYYKAVNLDKKQFVRPHACNNGAKLMEFGLSGMGMMSCLAILLADGNGRGGGDLYSENPIIGSWAGDRIVITGDYADDGKFIPESQGPLEWDGKEHEDYNLYTLANEDYGWKDISIEAMRALTDDRYVKKIFEKEAAESEWAREKYAEILKDS